MIVSEIRESRKIEDGLLLSKLIILVVEDLNLTGFDEIHLFNATLVTNNGFARLVDPAIKTDNEFVNETSFTLFEEMVEVSLESLELSSLGNQLGLHLWCHLLIEWELLNHQIIIVKEGLVDVVLDIVVEIGLNMERLVRLLNLLDPHVERVQLLIDEVLEVVGGVED